MRVSAVLLTVVLLGRPGLSGAAGLPGFNELRSQHRSSLSAVLDRRGETVAQIRTNHQVLQTDWVALEDFSPALITMVLRSEDQDFARHWGVDFPAVLAALRQTAQGQRRGASTLSMQLVGMLDPELLRRGEQRTISQKAAQAAAALWLERRWNKAQILEAYLNKVPLQGELVGIPAASRALFGKAPQGLDLEKVPFLLPFCEHPMRRLRPWPDAPACF